MNLPFGDGNSNALCFLVKLVGGCTEKYPRGWCIGTCPPSVAENSKRSSREGPGGEAILNQVKGVVTWNPNIMKLVVLNMFELFLLDLWPEIQRGRNKCFITSTCSGRIQKNTNKKQPIQASDDPNIGLVNRASLMD